MDENGRDKENQGDGNLSIGETSSSNDILQIDSPNESSVPDSGSIAVVSSNNLSSQDHDSLDVADPPHIGIDVANEDDGDNNNSDGKLKTTFEDSDVDATELLVKDTDIEENNTELNMEINMELNTDDVTKVFDNKTDKVVNEQVLIKTQIKNSNDLMTKKEKLEKKELVAKIKSSDDGNEDELIVHTPYNIFNKKAKSDVEGDDNKEDYVELDSIVQELEDACNDVVSKEDSPKVSLKNNFETKENPPKFDHSKDNRCIWITNINPSTSANRLKFDLSKYGKVVNAKIMTNGEKYYGYALMDNAEDAKVCITKLNGLKINGFIVQLNTEQPQKSLKHPKKSEDKKIKTAVNREERLKSIKDAACSTDPLTLVVGEAKKRPKPHSRSSSRRRNIKKKRDEEEEARLKRQRMSNYLSRMKKREDMKKQHDEEMKMKRQRELKLQLDIEKRKLEQEKRQFQKEKMEFMRQQRKLDEEKRAQERRDKILREKELNDRKRSTKSPLNWKRSKSPSRKVNLEKSVPSIILDNRLATRKRMSVSPLKTNHYKREMYRSPSPKRDRKVYPREQNRILPPPPPRLTHSDIDRVKVEPWKTDMKKVKIDYYKSKDHYSSMTEPKKIQYHQVDNYNDKRYRDDRNLFNLKYDKEDDKYKEPKKRLFEPQYKDPHSVRSEVYHPQQRNAYTASMLEPQRRFDALYPGQYSNERYPNINMGFSHFDNSNWKQLTFNKEYQHNAPPKIFHQEHPTRYDEFEKRHQYYAPRKY